MLDLNTNQGPNRVLVLDNRTCNVYSVPSAALKVPSAAPVVVDMEDLQTLAETQHFSIGGVLKHVRATNERAFTDDHVGVLATARTTRGSRASG